MSLLDDVRVVGDFALQTTVKLPTGPVGEEIGTGTTDFNVLVISSHSLGAVSLDVNAGLTTRSGDGSVVPTRATLWTVLWGLPV